MMRTSRLVPALREHWSGTTTKLHYGVFRVLFVGGFFLLPEVTARVWPSLLPGGRLSPLLELTDIPEAMGQRTLLLRLVPLPLPPPSWLAAVLIIVAVLATIGVCTRVALGALALGYLYAGSAINSFGFIAHDTTFPMIVLAVLAFSPGVETCSVDAYLRSRRQAGSSWTGFGRRVAVWPARLLLVVLALVYFSSGFAKVRESGLSWMDGQTLQAYALDPQPAPYLLQDSDPSHPRFRDGIGLESFLYSSGRPTPILRAVAESDLAMMALSSLSLLWELTFPIVLVVRRLLGFYLLAGLAFHLTVAVTFRLPSFYSYPLCYLVFVDWNRVAATIRRPRRRAATVHAA